MSNRMSIAIMILFIVLAIALSTVAFANDRMVVKIAMFAAGIGFGIAITRVFGDIRGSKWFFLLTR